MKRLLLLSFLLSLLFVSCTVQDDRTGGLGDPDCPYCHGDGYFKKTDLLIFETYYDCSCKSRRNYYNEDGEYNVSFKGTHCNGTVGCSCPGFAPITDGDVWEQSYCKYCSHKKSAHK